MAQSDNSIARYLSALAAAQGRTQAQIERLVEAQNRTEERIERVEAQIERLVEAIRGLVDRVGNMRGTLLEIEYRNKAPACFGQIVRRARVVPHEALDALLEPAVEQGVLSLEEKQDLIQVDLVVHGRRQDAEIHLAVEVSGVIDAHNAQRAACRAGGLAKLVLPLSVPNPCPS